MHGVLLDITTSVHQCSNDTEDLTREIHTYLQGIVHKGFINYCVFRFYVFIENFHSLHLSKSNVKIKLLAYSFVEFNKTFSI